MFPSDRLGHVLRLAPQLLALENIQIASPMIPMTKIAPTQTPALKISPASSQPARLTIEISRMIDKLGECRIPVLHRCNCLLQIRAHYADCLTKMQFRFLVIGSGRHINRVTLLNSRSSTIPKNVIFIYLENRPPNSRTAWLNVLIARHAVLPTTAA
jgi:hypothetical protein